MEHKVQELRAAFRESNAQHAEEQLKERLHVAEDAKTKADARALGFQEAAMAVMKKLAAVEREGAAQEVRPLAGRELGPAQRWPVGEGEPGVGAATDIGGALLDSVVTGPEAARVHGIRKIIVCESHAVRCVVLPLPALRSGVCVCTCDQEWGGVIIYKKSNSEIKIRDSVRLRAWAGAFAKRKQTGRP